MYSANTIANYFIHLAQMDKENLTPMKLLKLVYFAHAWHLALKDSCLIDEPILAWQYGPVIKSVYQEFKHFGNQVIDDFSRDKDGEVYKINEHDQFTQAFLQKIWHEYGGYTSIELANLTHEKNSPWYQTWYQANGKHQYSAIIDNATIKQHYQDFIKK